MEKKELFIDLLSAAYVFVHSAPYYMLIVSKDTKSQILFDVIFGSKGHEAKSRAIRAVFANIEEIRGITDSSVIKTAIFNRAWEEYEKNLVETNQN